MHKRKRLVAVEQLRLLLLPSENMSGKSIIENNNCCHNEAARATARDLVMSHAGAVRATAAVQMRTTSDHDDDDDKFNYDYRSGRLRKLTQRLPFEATRQQPMCCWLSAAGY